MPNQRVALPQRKNVRLTRRDVRRTFQKAGRAKAVKLQSNKVQNIPVSKKDFEKLFDISCGSMPAVHNFEVDWSKFKEYGRVLYFDMLRKGAAFTAVAPGTLGIYLKTAFAWFLKKHGCWQNADDNIQSAGSLHVPDGIATLFKQCSYHKNKRRGYELKVATSTSPAGVFSTQQDYPQGQYAVIDDVVIADNAGTHTTLSAAQLQEIDQRIKAIYKSNRKIDDIEWGASSGELFTGVDGTALQPTYGWASAISLLLPSSELFLNFHSPPHAWGEQEVVIADFLLNNLGDQDTIRDVLIHNGYDPMYFMVRKITMNSYYLAQSLYRVYVKAGGEPAEFFNFCQVAWSYIASYFPLITNLYHPETFCDPKFRKFIVPYPLQVMAKQSSCRVGSTYFCVDINHTGNWSYYYTGANTSSLHGFGTPGFLSSNVPGPVTFAGVERTSGGQNLAYTIFSWIHASTGYALIENQLKNMFGMASVMSDKMIDCACFAKHEFTSGDDNIVDAYLGTLTTEAISEITCASKLPVGTCEVAVFTWRSLYAGPYVMSGNAKMYLNAATDSNLQSVISYSVAGQNTSVQVLQAARKDIGNYVHSQASGGYDYYKLSEDQLKDMIINWASGSPTVANVTKSFGKMIADNLPAYVNADEIVHLAGSVGQFGIQSLVQALTGKMIGLSRGAIRDEL